jgi:hypothetical protein
MYDVRTEVTKAGYAVTVRTAFGVYRAEHTYSIADATERAVRAAERAMLDAGDDVEYVEQKTA